MRCEDAIEQIETAGAKSSSPPRAVLEHALTCADCRAALFAIDALRALRDEPSPIAADDAIERAIDEAVNAAPAAKYRRGFWSGAVSGAALAATVAAVAVGVWMQRPDDGAVAAPEVRLVLNQPRAVTVTLESPEQLLNADVRVVLNGAIGLEGYEGQRELRWTTNLDRGINQLTLPVVAFDVSGGQVLVEVAHGDKRRTFVVDVRAASAG